MQATQTCTTGDWHDSDPIPRPGYSHLHNNSRPNWKWSPYCSPYNHQHITWGQTDPLAVILLFRHGETMDQRMTFKLPFSSFGTFLGNWFRSNNCPYFIHHVCQTAVTTKEPPGHRWGYRWTSLWNDVLISLQWPKQLIAKSVNIVKEMWSLMFSSSWSGKYLPWITFFVTLKLTMRIWGDQLEPILSETNRKASSHKFTLKITPPLILHLFLSLSKV